MNMAGHDAPAVYLEALVLLAVLPAIQYNLPVFVADEQVYPVQQQNLQNKAGPAL